MNKKIIALLSCILMLPQSVSYAFLEDIDDVPVTNIMEEENTLGQFAAEEVHEAFKLLSYIGCITEPEEMFDENATVTKAYAATCFSLISKWHKNDSDCVFLDVSNDYEYADGIYSALEKGIIEKSEKFYPNKSISISELSDMAINTIKYDMIYLNDSAYDAARDLKLFKNVSCSNDSITKGQFLLFLENLVNSDYIEVRNAPNNDGLIADIIHGKSYLEKNFGIYIQTGIVTGYRYSSIYNDDDIEENALSINREIFVTDSDYSFDWVGKAVNAYVDEENDNCIVSLLPNDKKNKTYAFGKADYMNSGVSNISYESNGRKTNVKIADDALFMYNNVYRGLYIQSENYNAVATADKCEIIDNDADGRGDIVKIDKYSYYRIKSVSVNDKNIIFDYFTDVLVCEDDVTAIFTFKGEDIGIEGLKKGDVLAVLEAKKNNRKIFNSVVSRNVTEGIVKVISSDEEGSYYTVDGKNYYLADSFERYLSKAENEHKPKSGEFIRLYTAFDDKVVAIGTEEEFFYGYIMSGVVDADEDFVNLKIYNTMGEVATYSLADKVRVYNEKNISGVKKDRLDAIGIYLDVSDVTSRQINKDIVAYTLDEQNNITSIVKPVDRTRFEHGSLNYPLTLDYDGTNDANTGFLARIYREVFASQYSIPSSVPILTIPLDANLQNDEKAYGIKSSTSWGAEGKRTGGLNFKLYNCDKFFAPEFCTMNDVVEQEMGQGDYGDTYMYCIESVKHTLDEDDMPTVAISYYDNGALVTSEFASEVTFVTPGLYCDVDSLEKLKRGDVVQIKKNSLGKIYLVSVLFSIKNRPSEFGAYFPSSTTVSADNVTRIVPKENILDTTAYALTVLYGKVKDVGEKVVLLNTSKSGNNDAYTRPVVLGNGAYKAVYYTLYDTKSNMVLPASLSEIHMGDTVLMRRYYNSIQDVIIIR